MNVRQSHREALKLWIVLARAYGAVEHRVAADAARHGLTLAEFGVLEALYHKGPLLLGDLQRRILVSSGGITYLVNRLERRGLVRRERCPDDGRARYANLTAGGVALVKRAFPEHARVIAEALGGLTRAQQRDATRLLRALGHHAAAPPGADETEREGSTVQRSRRQPRTNG
jgi:MarR family 2-MHQ and catechol resistance regulon transcriptional repressor